MKTTFYNTKSTRYTLIFACIMLGGLSLDSLITDISQTWMIIWVIFFSLALGMIIGYQWALNHIVSKCISSFGESVKLSAKGTTVLSGRITLKTDGLKVYQLAIKDDSFKKETSDKKRAIYYDDYTLLIGENLTSNPKNDN